MLEGEAPIYPKSSEVTKRDMLLRNWMNSTSLVKAAILDYYLGDFTDLFDDKGLKPESTLAATLDL
jgi:hypothetical protein